MRSKHKASWIDRCEMPSPIRIAPKHASRLSQTYLTYHQCHMICCCRDHGSFSSASTFHCGDRGSRHWDGWGGWGLWSWGMWRLRGRFESWGGWADRHGAWGWRWGRGHSCLYPSWRDELLAWVCYRSALISACKTTCIVLMHSSQSKDWYICSLAHCCCNLLFQPRLRRHQLKIKSQHWHGLRSFLRIAGSLRCLWHGRMCLAVPSALTFQSYNAICRILKSWIAIQSGLRHGLWTILS